jgi:23S rRNA pseudouridine1911/1915/1917 synthase
MPRRNADPNSRIFHAAAEHEGQTLAAALKSWMPELSWNRARQLIGTRHVQINGNLCLDHGRRLKEKEVVKYFAHPLAPPPTEGDIQIVYQDHYFVVVNKPAGITSVRHRDEVTPKGKDRKSQATVEDLLPKVLERLAGNSPEKPVAQRGRRVGRRPPAPGRARLRVFPVHRLDRDTSGLMIFALTTAVEKQFIEMFRVHSVDRVYRAVAHGNVRGMRIESNLARDRGDGVRGSVEGEQEKTQHAVTHVRPVKGLGKYTLIECRLETGRTHQIRIHLSERGHMLCGERVYCKATDGRVTTDHSGAPRLALHAAELQFLHPVTGRKIKVDAPLPPDLAQFVKRLERDQKTPRDKKQGPA